LYIQRQGVSQRTWRAWFVEGKNQTFRKVMEKRKMEGGLRGAGSKEKK
jgi:hypothetical protein